MVTNYECSVFSQKQTRPATKRYITSDQRKKLLQISSEAYILYEFYIGKSGIPNYRFTDSQASAALGWGVRKIQSIRLSLEKAGWVSRVSLRNQRNSTTYSRFVLGPPEFHEDQ